MTTDFDVDARAGQLMQGGRGIGSGLRSMFGGESFFTVVYTARADDQTLILAPDQAGDIKPITLSEDTPLMLAQGAYLACTPGIKFHLHYAGLKGLLATRGLFFLKTVGSGTLFLASYGSIIERQLIDGEQFILDNRNILCFSTSIQIDPITLTKTAKGSFFAGEGFVVRLTGQGTVLYQTRARRSGNWLSGIIQAFT